MTKTRRWNVTETKDTPPADAVERAIAYCEKDWMTDEALPALHWDEHWATIVAAARESVKGWAAAERLAVQLAGCSVAALGYGEDLSPDAYGYSASYDDVMRLRKRAEQAEAERDKYRALVENFRHDPLVKALEASEAANERLRGALADAEGMLRTIASCDELEHGICACADLAQEYIAKVESAALGDGGENGGD
jgi:hypothetical protein